MWTNMNIRPIDRRMMTHYQCLWTAKCGVPVLVYWDGKKPDKTQLDEHEEKCPDCNKVLYRRKKLKKICSKLVIE